MTNQYMGVASHLLSRWYKSLFFGGVFQAFGRKRCNLVPSAIFQAALWAATPQQICHGCCREKNTKRRVAANGTAKMHCDSVAYIFNPLYSPDVGKQTIHWVVGIICILFLTGQGWFIIIYFSLPQRYITPKFDILPLYVQWPRINSKR